MQFPSHRPLTTLATLMLVWLSVAAPSYAETAAEPANGEAAAVVAPEEADAAPVIEVDPREALQESLAALAAEIAEQEGLLTESQSTAVEQRLAVLRDIHAAKQHQLSIYGRMDALAAELEEVAAQRAQFEAEGFPDDPPFTLARLDALEDEAAAAARSVQVTQIEIRTVRTLIAQSERALNEAQQTRRRLHEEARADVARQPEYRLSQLRERRAEQELALQRLRLEDLIKREAIGNERTSFFRLQASHVRPYVAFDDEGLGQRLGDIAERRGSLDEQLRRLERQRTEHETAVTRARQAAAAAQQGEDPEAIARAQERLVAREAWLSSSTEGVQYLERRLAGLYDEERMWQRRHAVLNLLTAEEYPDWAAETAAIKTTLADIRGMVETRVNELRTAQLELENRANNAPESIADIEAHRSRLEALQAMEAHARAYLTNIAGRQSVATRLLTDIESRFDAPTLRERAALVWTQVQEVWHRELFVVDDRPFTLARLVPSSFVFFLVLFAVYLIKLLLMRVVLRRIVRDSQEYSSVARHIVLALSKSTHRLFVVVIAAYFASGVLPLSERAERFVAVIASIALLAQLGIWINDALQRMLEASKRRREAKDPSSVSAFGLFSVFGRIAIAAVVFLAVLRSLDYDITAIIAGLGIGGIAVAFALQNILGDIFCSVAILLDKPFVVGDFIIVGDQKGSVEHIGIKTTRIRSLSGEQIIFSNTDLVGSRIQNFKRMYERRVGFTIGVVYETPREKVARIPGIIRGIIEDIDNARFDRSHFARFEDFSLDVDTVYYVTSPDFAEYMDIQQQINLEMMRIFEEEEIVFAYPTRELILRGFSDKKNPAVTLLAEPAPEEG